MPPEFRSPPELYAAPYEYAAVSGGLVFAAGACPINANGRVVSPGDYEAQAHAAVENLTAALAGAGAALGDVLKTTVYVAAREHSDLLAVWRVVESGFAPARPPSTLLGVSMLGYAGQLVEIEAVAAVGA